MTAFVCHAKALGIIVACVVVGLLVGWVFMRLMGLLWPWLPDDDFISDAGRGFGYLLIAFSFCMIVHLVASEICK